jgi:hypothetical protein
MTQHVERYALPPCRIGPGSGSQLEDGDLVGDRRELVGICVPHQSEVHEELHTVRHGGREGAHHRPAQIRVGDLDRRHGPPAPPVRELAPAGGAGDAGLRERGDDVPAAVAAIQRLVARGYLTREPDPEDRRRAVVALTPSARRLAERIYGPVGEAGVAVLRRWSAAELELIADFLERGRALQLAEAARIRALGVGGRRS